MIKAPAGNFGIGQDVRSGKYVPAAASFNGWLNKTRLVLRHFVVANKASADVGEAYIVRQQEKTSIAARHVKDELFYSSTRSRFKSIPRKTWKRHSAFLVYRQQMINLETE